MQNKVSTETARATLAEIEAGFAAHDTVVEVLVLWRYRGGPWEAVEEFAFRLQASRGAVGGPRCGG